ncbi:hypothetical protein AAIH25_15235 [Arthrobacter crystallopoietes]|uniref:hypothetical protein n=1 Tax=Crystallibacter crystallopoietes TaxID=37928 RepID=UPI003D1C2109
MTAVAVPPPARIPLWKSKAAPAPYPACQPIDAALALTVTEHIHCGEPMALISGADLPITGPLMILTPDNVVPEYPDRPIPVYRCQCGFTLDAL